MSAPAREALWARLQGAGAAQGALPPAQSAAPWFVRLMLGIAGWIGALFLLGFVGMGLQFIIRTPSAMLAAGAAACLAAAAVFRAERSGELVTQFAFAVSLAGQALLAVALFELLERSSGAAAAAVALQQAILFLVVPNFVHRTWTAWSGAYAAAFALQQVGVAAYAAPALIAAFALVELREFDDPRRAERLRAAGYGFALAALQSAFAGERYLAALLDPRASASSGWAGALASAAVVVLAAAALLRRERLPLGSRHTTMAMMGALLVAALSLKAPGIAPASVILVFGYANANRVLAGLGIFALIGYLSYYYYSLEATLLYKSALLAVAGAAFLLARLAMLRLEPGKEAARA